MQLTPYSPGCSLRGAFIGMPMRDYMRAPGLNASSLKLILDSPLTFKRKRDGLLPYKKTQATELGTVLHATILEGKIDYHTRPDTYGDGKKWSSNATECKAWVASHSDKPILTSEEAAFVAESFSYVRSHQTIARTAGGLLSGGHPEVSMFAEIDGRLFKARCDYYKPGCITDLKSCTDASLRGFGSAVHDWGWDLQAALYLRVAAALGDDPTFRWIALQKGPLPLVRVVNCTRSWVNVGNGLLDKALDLLFKCEVNGEWPEWSDFDGEHKPYELPVPQWLLGDEPLSLKVGGIEANY